MLDLECHGVHARFSVGHPSEDLQRADGRHNRDRSQVHAGRESLMRFLFSSPCGRYAQYLARPERCCQDGLCHRQLYSTRGPVHCQVVYWGPARAISLSLRLAKTAPEPAGEIAMFFDRFFGAIWLRSSRPRRWDDRPRNWNSRGCPPRHAPRLCPLDCGRQSRYRLPGFQDGRSGTMRVHRG